MSRQQPALGYKDLVAFSRAVGGEPIRSQPKPQLRVELPSFTIGSGYHSADTQVLWLSWPGGDDHRTQVGWYSIHESLRALDRHDHAGYERERRALIRLLVQRTCRLLWLLGEFPYGRSEPLRLQSEPPVNERLLALQDAAGSNLRVMNGHDFDIVSLWGPAAAWSAPEIEWQAPGVTRRGQAFRVLFPLPLPEPA